MKGADRPELGLEQYKEILLRRRWVFAAVWAACALAGALYAFLARPVYEGSTLVELEKPNYTRALEPGGGYIDALDEEYFETEYRLFKSDTLTQRVYDELHLERTADFAPPLELKKLQDAVTVEPVRRTRLAYVRVRSHDPDLAVLISTSLAGAFVRDHVNNTMFMSRDVLQALQLDRAGAGKTQLYESLPAVVDNRLVQAIKEARVGVEGQLSELERRYTPYHPDVVAARGHLAALDRILRREILNIVASLRAQLSGELLGNNVRVVDPAKRPFFPVWPRKGALVALGTLGGLVLGLFAAALVELLDQSIRSEEDVERKLGRPFLGSVPFARHDRQGRVYQPLLSPAPSLTSEAFRNLRTMVDFAGAGSRATPLLVASSVKDEGKSFVSANLAVVFAQIGHRVLLIDGDLRRPSIHKKFALSSERGLSDFLAGAAPLEQLDSLVQPSEVPNLGVLVCGPKPPNPAELLNTPRLAALMEWAKGRYDRVIVDCPPLFPISDTLLWGRQVPCAVFVARFGLTRASLVNSACERLRAGGVAPLGVVINGARAAGLTYAGGTYYEQYYSPN